MKSERSRVVKGADGRVLRKEDLEAFLDTFPKTVVGENSTRFLRRQRLEWDGRPLDVLKGCGGQTGDS